MTGDGALPDHGGRWVSTDQTEPGKWIMAGGLLEESHREDRELSSP